MKKDKGRKKWLIAAIAAIVVSTTAVGSTYAMLKRQTDEKVNAFRTGIVNIAIQEEFTQESVLPKTGGSVTKSVYIKNTYDGQEVLKDRIVPVYIRAALVPQWKDGEGNLLAIDRTSVVFETKLNDTASGWVAGDDGYFYYTKPVDPEKVTSELLASVSVKQEYAEKIPNDAHLEVEVLADAVQANGTARADAWGSVKSGDREISFQ